LSPYEAKRWKLKVDARNAQLLARSEGQHLLRADAAASASVSKATLASGTAKWIPGK
jgi:hypothetical protein